MFVRTQLTFIWGFALGISAASMLFYSWHMESLTRLQQQWLADQQNQQQLLSKAQQPQSQIETIDLLMKSYSISDGNEDQDMRAELIRSNHLSLLLEVQQQAGVDVTDLIDPARPCRGAQSGSGWPVIRLIRRREICPFASDPPAPSQRGRPGDRPRRHRDDRRG